MGRVDGRRSCRTACRTPLEGWLLEASTPAEQRRLQDSAIDVLADIHAIDWRGAGLDRLDRPELWPRTGLDQQLRFYEGLPGVGPGDHPTSASSRSPAGCGEPDPTPTRARPQLG